MRAFALPSVLLVSLALAAAGETSYPYWVASYGEFGTEFAYNVAKTADGGYVFAGTTDSNSVYIDPWVAKLDGRGGVIWSKRYETPWNDTAQALDVAGDGTIYVVGNSQSYGTGSPSRSENLWVLKLQADGAIEWQKAIGAERADRGFSVKALPEGGAIVAASMVRANFQADLWLIKFRSDGSIEWQKSYGGGAAAQHDLPSSYNAISLAPDGDIYVSATTESYGAGLRESWLLRLNPDGSIQWQKTLGGLKHDLGGAVVALADGGAVVAGTTESFGFQNPIFNNASSYDVWVIRFTDAGDVAWQQTFGSWEHDYSEAVAQFSDGDLAIVGRVQSFDAGQAGDVWVLRLNLDGTLDWQKRYGGGGTDHGYSAVAGHQGGLVVAAASSSVGAGLFDAWILDLGPDGVVDWVAGAGVQTHDTWAEVRTPDPAPSAMNSLASPATTSETLVTTTAVAKNKAGTVEVQARGASGDSETDTETPDGATSDSEDASTSRFGETEETRTVGRRTDAPGVVGLLLGIMGLAAFLVRGRRD